MVAEVGHVGDLVGHAAIRTHILSSFIYLRKALHAASAGLLAIKSTSPALNALRYRHSVVYRPALVFISFTVYDKVLTLSQFDRIFEFGFMLVLLLLLISFFALRLIGHVIVIITYLLLFWAIIGDDGVDIFG